MVADKTSGAEVQTYSVFQVVTISAAAMAQATALRRKEASLFSCFKAEYETASLLSPRQWMSSQSCGKKIKICRHQQLRFSKALLPEA